MCFLTFETTRNLGTQDKPAATERGAECPLAASHSRTVPASGERRHAALGEDDVGDAARRQERHHFVAHDAMSVRVSYISSIYLAFGECYSLPDFL